MIDHERRKKPYLRATQKEKIMIKLFLSYVKRFKINEYEGLKEILEKTYGLRPLTKEEFETNKSPNDIIYGYSLILLKFKKGTEEEIINIVLKYNNDLSRKQVKMSLICLPVLLLYFLPKDVAQKAKCEFEKLGAKVKLE